VRMTMHKLLRPLWVVLALTFLLEAWLWDHLQPIVARTVDLIPWARLKAHLATLIKGLSPKATLVVFIVPVVVVFPIKLLEVWLWAHHQWLSALAALLLVKLVGLGVTAFVFELTREKLLLIGWFNLLYVFVMWLRRWAEAIVEPEIQRIRQILRVFAPRHTDRAFRLLLRIRHRMRARGAL
jgi:hypothetical protein